MTDGEADHAVDKIAPIWFEFGTHANGNKEVAEVGGDVLTDLPPAVDAKVIELRNRFRADLTELLLNLTPKRAD